MTVFRSVVKWFDAKKGYGFIVHPQGEADVFVHYSSIDTDRRFRTLRTGQVVDFELRDGPKGMHAYEVRSLEPVEPPHKEAPGTALPETAPEYVQAHYSQA